jgi:tetratricopeptide (TPR) repeat protein
MDTLSSRKSPLVIIAAASADLAQAGRLQQALLDRGLRVVSSAEVGVAEKRARLIVLCSPAALKCQALNNFLEDFTWSNGMRHIHVVGLETERPLLPMALRAERRSNGSFWTLPSPPVIGALYNDDTSVEVLADDIAHECTSEPGVTLARSIASGIAHRPLATGLAAASALMLGVTVWQADQISAYQEEATQAQAFTSRLLTDITENLPQAARQETLLRLADDLTRTYLDTSGAGLSDDELGRRARLFSLIGEARDRHGQTEEARQAFMAAFELTQALLDRSPNNLQRVYDHAQAAYWVGYQAYRNGDMATAEVYMDIYARMAETLVAREPGNPSYQAERGYAALNLGAIELDTGDPAAATALFEQALEVFENGLLEEGAIGLTDLANTLGWLADAQRDSGALREALETRERELALYEEQLERSPGVTSVILNIAHTQGEIAGIATDLGLHERSAQLLDEALDTVNALFTASPENDSVSRIYVQLIHQRASVAMSRNEIVRAQLLIGEARRLAARTNETGENDGLYMTRTLALTLSSQLAFMAGSYETAVLESTQAISAGEQAIANGHEVARSALAHAYYIRGESLDALGQSGEADAMFRSALSQLGMIAEPRRVAALDLESRIYWRLGDVARAMQGRRALEARGYANISFQRFWEEVDRNGTAQAEPTQGG